MSAFRMAGAALILLLVPGGAVLAPAPAAAEAGPPDFHAPTHEGIPEKFPDHPAVGEAAPDFSLRDLDGRWTGLGEFLGRGYVVLFFGSISSTVFRKSAPDLERLAKSWSRLEVKVILVYTREAHPAALKKAPQDYRERAALACKAREDLHLDIPILVDEWDDAVHKAYGAIPEAAFLLDSHGTIQLRQAQAGAASLQKELMRLLKLQEPPG
jgi:peroxiredoxin